MMSLLINAEIVKHQQVATGYWLLEFLAPKLVAKAKPGQFVHLNCAVKHAGTCLTSDPFLRRPVSIHRVDSERGTVSLLYKVVGRGTMLLSTKQAGDLLDVMGPLGQGFTLPTTDDRRLTTGIAVVAGGIGIAPLYFLVQRLLDDQIMPVIYMGARSAADLLAVAEIKALGQKERGHTTTPSPGTHPKGRVRGTRKSWNGPINLDVYLATDDGSAGDHGLVTALLTAHWDNINLIYTCGPKPMMRAVALLAKEKNIPVQVSLEERMACGVGACLACVCQIKAENKTTYKRVCADGPVFNAEDVVWES